MNRYKSTVSNKIHLLVIGVAVALCAVQLSTGRPFFTALATATGIGLVLWSVLAATARGTSYEVRDGILYTHMLWRTREIEISRIRLVVDADRPAAGNHPGLGDDGLMVHYGAGGLLYISPVDKASFVRTLLAANEEIIYRQQDR